MSNSVITRQIYRINEMNQEDLRNKFAELFGFEAGQTSVPNLRSRLAAKIQEICIGGISAEDDAILKLIIASDPMARLSRMPKNEISKVAGTRYERIWKGKKYEVIVLGKNSFDFAGEKYTSLSAVAKAITGTHWNGKLFFGVK